MYDNIGQKIKKLAKALFVIAAIGAVITGFALLAIDEDLIFVGLLAMVGGPFIAWLSSWILYAFGELVEDIHAMRNKDSLQSNEIHDSTTNIDGLQYYISDKGVKKGPYNQEQLTSMVNDGILLPNSYVWKKGMSKWIYAKEADVLKDLFSASPNNNE